MKIKEQLEANMKAGIDAVLAGATKEFKAEFTPPSMVVDYMESIGWEKGELDTNGWQYDWWIQFGKEDESFTASGCGWDGDFHFERTED